MNRNDTEEIKSFEEVIHDTLQVVDLESDKIIETHGAGTPLGIALDDLSDLLRKVATLLRNA